MTLTQSYAVFCTAAPSQPEHSFTGIFHQRSPLFSEEICSFSLLSRQYSIRTSLLYIISRACQGGFEKNQPFAFAELRRLRIFCILLSSEALTFAQSVSSCESFSSISAGIFFLYRILCSRLAQKSIAIVRS